MELENDPTVIKFTLPADAAPKKLVINFSINGTGEATIVIYPDGAGHI